MRMKNKKKTRETKNFHKHKKERNKNSKMRKKNNKLNEYDNYCFTKSLKIANQMNFWYVNPEIFDHGLKKM
jgi:hypothetical protein